jgi:hypothetical protein
MCFNRAWLAVVLLCMVTGSSAQARYYDPSTGRFISRDPVDNVENQMGVGAVATSIQTVARFVSRAQAQHNLQGGMFMSLSKVRH